MPIYEYKCEKCDNEFELILFGNEEVICPSCGAKNPIKKISSFGFAVNGKYTPSSTGSGPSCAGCSSSNCSSCSG